MQGIFTVQMVDRFGKVINSKTEKNLIVDKARYDLARIISGASGYTGKYINTIGFGTSTAAPTNADTTLTTPYTKAIDSVAYTDGISVTFNWSLGLTENNGMAITEFGLLLSNGDLFSRKVRSAINKASDFSLNGTWQIIF